MSRPFTVDFSRVRSAADLAVAIGCSEELIASTIRLNEMGGPSPSPRPIHPGSASRWRAERRDRANVALELLGPRLATLVLVFLHLFPRLLVRVARHAPESTGFT